MGFLHTRLQVQQKESTRLSFSSALLSKLSFLECVCAVFAYVQLHLQEDAVYRFAAATGRKIHIVLEAEFRELAGVKREVRRKTPPLPYQIPLRQVHDEWDSLSSAGAVDVVHPKTGDPAIDETVRNLAIEPVILQPRGRNGVDDIGSRLVVPMQVLRLPGYERKALGVVHRLPFHVQVGA